MRAAMDPVSLSTYSPLLMLSFVDSVNDAVPPESTKVVD